MALAWYGCVALASNTDHCEYHQGLLMQYGGDGHSDFYQKQCDTHHVNTVNSHAGTSLTETICTITHATPRQTERGCQLRSGVSLHVESLAS